MKKLFTVSFCVLCISYLGLKAQVYSIHTYAGTGVPSYFGNHIKAISAWLNYPCGVAADVSGNVFVADYDNNRIREINTGDTIFNIAGNGTYGFSGDSGIALNAKISRPSGVAFDKSGNLYIADYNNCRIRKMNTSGIITTFAGNGTPGDAGDYGLATAAQINYPLGVTVDRFGNVFIAEGISNCVRQVNTYGAITTLAGNRTLGFSGDGGEATAAELSYPFAVATDYYGNVFIADQNNNRIREVNTSGIISTVAGNGIAGFSGDGGASTACELNQPQGVAFDAAGNMYITDHSNQRIRIVNTYGNIKTIAGNGTQGFSGDGGTATSAELYYPAGPVAIDALGNVFIADENNQRIRKLTLTVAGFNELNTESSDLQVFPNPSNGIFTVLLPEIKYEKSRMDIYNLLGEKVFSQNITANIPYSLNLSDRPKGIYFYKVSSENGSLISTGKFIIE